MEAPGVFAWPFLFISQIVRVGIFTFVMVAAKENRPTSILKNFFYSTKPCGNLNIVFLG